MKDERGITLVELLATLTLMFIVGSVVFSVTLSTINHYQQSEIESQVQSDLNRFIAHLTDIHQTHKQYDLTRIDSSTYVVRMSEDQSYTFDGHGGIYDIAAGAGERSLTNLAAGDTISVDHVDDLRLLIEVTDPSNKRFKPVTLTTTITQIIGSKERD
ncbi:type II secretion system protein [Piscibacillus salipiscarius]|uniref:Type II secretion system protein n=1 Tax=Piscibacillus salipiscarius TaxID=299480 RepID=A0ABW5QB47_9BACI|nr:prepilin-type N-terminal cleavage/methylation domain-containing protein [Piscibacillus salipiscarius]